MEKINEFTSENIVQQNIERLKEIFPTAFSEGKLVVEELQALVGEYIEKDKEFYQMTWAGKTQAQKEANKVSTATLRPNKTDSKDWDTTGNIFIEGDNLEVLKLLQKTYSNKIKMIYIDPPYNTGKDFVYKDNYKDNLSNYLEITGQTDEEGKKLSTNTDSDGRYHSNWLNMMYPRLKLARNLMTDDGVIFISIDDNEQANLKKVCDEIFGEENFISSIVVSTGANQGGEGVLIQKNIEFVLCYSKNIDSVIINKVDEVSKTYRNLNDAPTPFITRPDMGYTLYYNEKTNDIIPKFDYDKKLIHLNKEELVYKNDETHINDGYVPIRPGIRNGKLHRWRWGIDTFKERINEIVILNKNGSFSVNFIQNGFNPPKNILNFSGGTLNLKKIFEANIFDYSKNPDFIKYLVKIGLHFDGICLDFFSGSGTTAHAVMALNAEDGGDRKCISVQLPEPTDEKSEAYKAGYKTIAEITKERIRRAGELIKQENADKEGIDKLDVGFRAFKLDSSNIQAWDTSIDKFEDQLEMQLENDGDNIKSERTEEDVLFEILLKYGLDLTLPIQEKEIDGCIIYNIGFGSMFICLSPQINVSVAKAIGEWSKEFEDHNPSVIFKDSGFANDADKTNTVQTLRQAGIENVKSI